ncbi:hypothetical protein NUM3379_06050 [Kineococcus sp. NUM-3379]
MLVAGASVSWQFVGLGRRGPEEPVAGGGRECRALPPGFSRRGERPHGRVDGEVAMGQAEHFLDPAPGQGPEALEVAALGTGVLLAVLRGDREGLSELIGSAPPQQAALSAVFCAQYAVQLLESLPPDIRQRVTADLQASALRLRAAQPSPQPSPGPAVAPDAGNPQGDEGPQGSSRSGGE